ncbi:MAG: GAF domain-containing protein, partial [Vicinamibacterales bacterium]
VTLAAARAEAEETLEVRLAAARAEAEETRAASLAAARVEADEAVTAKLATAQAEAEKRIVSAIRALDDARSLGETLDALAEGAVQHVARAAVLIVRGDRLRARRLAGFSGDNAEGAIDLDFDEAGLAGAVVRTGVSVSRPIVEPGDEARTRQPALPPFAQDAGARHAIALPIVVGERVVGVLYADAPQADAASGASRWPATLEVLARHASRALEAMTVHQVTGLSRPRPMPRVPGATPGQAGGGDEEAARRYARLLVSEIRMYHEPVVDAGRRARDLRTRLGGEIDRARRLYEERVPPTIRERSDFFEQELVRTLADGDRSLLG